MSNKRISAVVTAGVFQAVMFNSEKNLGIFEVVKELPVGQPNEKEQTWQALTIKLVDEKEVRKNPMMIQRDVLDGLHNEIPTSTALLNVDTDKRASVGEMAYINPKQQFKVARGKLELV